MSDVSPLADDWVGRLIATALGGIVTAVTTIFVTRKNAEAALMEKVNERLDKVLARQDQEIARLEGLRTLDRARCDQELAELRAEISGLMRKPAAGRV